MLVKKEYFVLYDNFIHNKIIIIRNILDILHIIRNYNIEQFEIFKDISNVLQTLFYIRKLFLQIFVFIS